MELRMPIIIIGLHMAILKVDRNVMGKNI